MSIDQEVVVAERDSMDAVRERIVQDTAALYAELCDMANMNPHFRSGLLDAVYVEVKEGMVNIPELSPGEMEELDDEGVDQETEILRAMLESKMKFGYRFEAQRSREILPDEKTKQKISLLFEFEVYGRHEGVVLPGYIAQEVMFDPDEDMEYMPAREAQHEVGLVEELRIRNFGFDGRTYDIMLCEGTTYLDSDGQVLRSACSCPGVHGEVMYVTGDVDADEDGDVLFADDDIRQYLADYAAQRLQSEPLELLDISTAVQEWTAVDPLTSEVDTYDHERKVREARIALRMIRTAFLRQFGLEATS